MISYSDAYMKARDEFVSAGYARPMTGALNLPDKWIFLGSKTKNATIEYGTCSIAVNKNTGDMTWYNCGSPLNLFEYLEAEPIALPT